MTTKSGSSRRFLILIGFLMAGACVKGLKNNNPDCGNGVVNAGEECDDGNLIVESTCADGALSCVICTDQCTQRRLGLGANGRPIGGGFCAGATVAATATHFGYFCTSPVDAATHQAKTSTHILVSGPITIAAP